MGAVRLRGHPDDAKVGEQHVPSLRSGHGALRSNERLMVVGKQCRLIHATYFVAIAQVAFYASYVFESQVRLRGSDGLSGYVSYDR